MLKPRCQVRGQLAKFDSYAGLAQKRATRRPPFL